MLLDFQLKSFEVHRMTKKADHPSRPRDRDCEIYHTWQVMRTPPLLPQEDEDASTYLLRQGYSAAGGLDGARRMKAGAGPEVGYSHTYSDPQFQFELPDLREGQTLRLNINMHHWERDSKKNTRMVKGLFSDPALANLLTVAEAQKLIREYRRGRKKELKKFAERLISQGANASGNQWVEAAASIAPDIIQAISTIAYLLRGEDDYWQPHAFDISIRRRAHEIEWRFTHDANRSAFWNTGVGSDGASLFCTSNTGAAIIEFGYVVRILD